MASPRKQRSEATESSATRTSDMARAQRSAMALRLAATIRSINPHASKAPAEAEPEAEEESEDAAAERKTPTGRRRTPTWSTPRPQTAARTPKPPTPKTPKRQSNRLSTPERDEALSVLSSDASPTDSVFDFLNSADGSGLSLFTPPPQIQTRAARSLSVASAASSPTATDSRHSSAASSPSQFFRSPVRPRKSSTGSSSHSRRHRGTPSPASTRITRTPRRPHSAKSTMMEPLEVRIKEESLPLDEASAHASSECVKQEHTDDLVPSSLLSPWPQPATTPKRSSSAIQTPSPPLKQAGFPLSRRLKDAFDETEAHDGAATRNSLDSTADDLFSAAPSELSGALSDHDSFFSFANSLSPLVNAEELEASFLSVRLSPMSSFTSYELPRLLPHDTEEGKRMVTPAKTPSSRRAARGSNSSSSGASASSKLRVSFPNIRASTSATPGKDERSKLESRSIMKTRLHSPFEDPLSFLSTRDFQAINNSLKRTGQGRKRKLEDKRSSFNVQRKLLHTPVKASPLRPARSPLLPLNGRTLSSSNVSSVLSLDGHEDEGVQSRTAQQRRADTTEKTPSSHSTTKRKAPDSPAVQEHLDPTIPPRANTPKLRKTMPPQLPSSGGAPTDNSKHPPAVFPATAPRTPLVLPKQSSVRRAPVCVAVPPIIASSMPKKAPCNCKKSKCLKLYCECFASGGYCDESCNCVGCSNTPAMETQRQEAINARLEKNPNAFKPKIEATALSPNSAAAAAALTATTTMMAGTLPGASVSSQISGSTESAAFLSPLVTQRLLFHHGRGGIKKMHKHGCHCKKSACQKKYCECFQAGVPCGDNCRCIDCKNQAPCVTHASPGVTSVTAMTPSREIDETFVSPVLQGVRKRLRIDRETWAKNFSSPYESSPTSLRERTERFRSHLQAVTHATTPLKAIAGASSTLSSSSSSSGSQGGPLSVRLKPIATPELSTPVRSVPNRARLSVGAVLSPLADAAPLTTSDTIIATNKALKGSASVLGGIANLRDSNSRVFVLPLFGKDLPPVRMSVCAQIFRFLTNADLHNASFVNRLWSQVALGDSVWDHANFIPVDSSEGDVEDEQRVVVSQVRQSSAAVAAAAAK